MDYEVGWSWANDRITNYSPIELQCAAELASIEFNDPDSFYEGALDCIDKLKEKLIS